MTSSPLQNTRIKFLDKHIRNIPTYDAYNSVTPTK